MLERPLPVFHGFKSGQSKGLVLSSTSSQTADYQKKMRAFSASQHDSRRKRSSSQMRAATANRDFNHTQQAHMQVAVEDYTTEADGDLSKKSGSAANRKDKARMLS